MLLSRLFRILALVTDHVESTMDFGSSTFGRKEEYREEFALAKGASGRTELSLENVNGTVDVSGIDELSEVRITGKKVVQDISLEEAKFHMSDIRIDVDDSSDIMRVRTHQPKGNRSRTYRVDYDIQIPRAWRVTVQNTNGQVELCNLTKKGTVKVSNGNVKAIDTDGDMFVEVMNGSISARMRMSQSGTCELRTMNGAVDLSIPRTTSATVEASTANGFVSVMNLPIQLETSSRTSVVGRLADGIGRVVLSSINGAVTLRGQ